MSDRRGIPVLLFAILLFPVFAFPDDSSEVPELPSARNLWAPLESQVAGVVSDRIDVGGLRSMAPSHFGGLGTTWTQNTFTIGSVDLTDPYSGGVPLVDPDLGAFEPARYLVDVHDAETSSPGIVVSLIPRRGERELHAGAQVDYTDRNAQSRAVTDREREAGIASPEHFGRFVQAAAQIGGPLGPAGPRYFATFATDRLVRYAENIQQPESWNHTSGTLSLSDEIGRHDVRAFGLLESQHDSALAVSSFQPPASSLDSTRTGTFASAADRFLIDESRMIEARLGYSAVSRDDRFPSGAAGQSAIELFEGTLSGPAPMASDGRRSRSELSLVGRRALGGSAALFGRDVPVFLDASFGGNWNETESSNRYRVLDDVNLQFLAGAPSMVSLFDPGARSRQRIRNLSMFVQTETRVGDFLTVSAGARLESTAGWLPGVSVGEARWTTLSPRFAVIAPAGRHFIFQGSYARSTHALLGRELEAADPRAPSGRVAFWNDANGDGQYQPGEEATTLRVFGGRNTTLDPHLRPPVSDEFELLGQWRPGPRLALIVTLRQTYEKHLIETVNTGVPASSYTPVPYVDPGGDGIPGTGDDRIITVYEQDPSALGQDHFLLTNPKGFRAFHRGAQIVLRWTDAPARLRLEASFTGFAIVGQASQGLTAQEYDEGVIGTLFDNPNTLIHSDGRLFFDRGYIAKAWGTYRLSHGFSAGCVAKYYDGTPYARKIVVTGLDQGPFYVFATQRGNLTLAGIDPRNGPRTEHVLTVDLGIEKAFRAGGGSLAARIDVFNLSNAQTKTRNVDVTGPEFQQAAETVAPRVARFGLRWNF
ncbi:MAG: hypothetical protein ACRD16_13715 [Thermoanaerobaculia bacterium]